MTNQYPAICFKPGLQLKAARFVLKFFFFNKDYSAAEWGLKHFKVEWVKEAFEKRHQRERGHTEDGAENVRSLWGRRKTKQSSI